MAADVDIHVYTAGPVDEGAKTAIAFLSIDSGASDVPTQLANKIVSGEVSYEKWMAAVIGATPPDNWCNDFKVWGDGAVMALTVLWYGFENIWANPTNAVSGKATLDFTARTAGDKGNWHTAGNGDPNLVNTGDKTKYWVMQLDVGATHPGGAWTQEILYYEYVEA